MENSLSRQQHYYYERVADQLTKNSVPEWEKRFCWEMGGIKWKDILKANRLKHLYIFDKILQWDDSAGKECFDIAKNRFWANNGGPPYQLPLPNPAMYIDEIDWDSELHLQPFLDLEAARSRVENLKQTCWTTPTCLENIKPTGWDVDFRDWNQPVVLTGMIVGDKHSFEDDDNGGVLINRGNLEDFNDGTLS